MFGFNKDQIEKIRKEAAKAAENEKRNLSVGDDVNVNFDPFGKHPNRWGVIEKVVLGGYVVRFTSTKGESCDGDIRKVHQRKDGTFVAATSVTKTVTYSQIK